MADPDAKAVADRFFADCGITQKGVGHITPDTRKGPGGWAVRDAPLQSFAAGFVGAIPTRGEGGWVIMEHVPATVANMVSGMAGRGPVRYDPSAAADHSARESW